MDKQIDKREALEGLFVEILKENDRVMYVIHYTQGEDYDCLVKQQSKKTDAILKKMFFKVRICGMYYDNVIIEKNDLDSMKKLISDLDTDKIYHVNFTPRNTAIFDLLKIEDEGKLFEEDEKVIMNIAAATTIEYVYTSKDITNEEYRHFIETGNISNDRLTSIAEKIIKQEPINDEEKAVYAANSTEVEQIIKAFNSPQPQLPEPDMLQNMEIPVQNNPFNAPANPTDQTTIELNVPERRGIRKDENGQVLYDTLEEFKSLPLSVQWLSVAQKRIKMWLKPGEDRLMMIELMGGEIELGDFLHKRAMDELFNRPLKKRTQNEGNTE